MLYHWAPPGGIARCRARFHPASLDVSNFLQGLLPIAELLLRYILGDAIRFLDLAGKAVALACNHVQLVIGELAPLLLGAALELLPVAFNAVLVHFHFLRID